jgi:GNAT superfamily N-acetyltransferase
MHPQPTIRPGRPDEALAVATLIEGSWRYAYRGILPQAVLDALEPTARAERFRERLATQGERCQVWVAQGDEALRGVVWFGSAGEHPIHPAPAGTGEIMALYLEPSWFGSGLADRMASEAEGWLAARFGTSMLWVLEDNHRARRFYTRRGWLADGTRTPYPKPGCRGVYLARHRWVAQRG